MNKVGQIERITQNRVVSDNHCALHHDKSAYFANQSMS
jgi:hypothetical protein